MEEPEQGSSEAVYVSAMVGEMMQRVLGDALAELARTRGTGYLDTFVERELARYADLFRERSGDTPETTSMLRAWFAVEGGAALRAVVERASADPSPISRALPAILKRKIQLLAPLPET